MIIYNESNKCPSLISKDGKYWKILGECNRCGECCLQVSFNEWDGIKDESGKCNYLIYETVNDKVQYRCSKEWNKPFGCALYPFNPLDENHFLPSCSFSFKEITKEEFITIIEKLV